VIDLGWVLAAPYTTMLLGYLGAEVIKVESRRRIDEQRIAHRAGLAKDYDASSNFFEVNLNKRSVTLNLATEKGAELTRRLVATSDIVIENMRPGVIDRLGLGYRDLVAVKPDIIMASVSGWGSQGPLREYTAYAPCFSSFSGLAHLTGYADGEPNTGTSSNDARSGTGAAFAILMALMIKQRTGRGQYIDMSSCETLNMLVGDRMVEYALSGTSPGRDGNHDGLLAPHNVYRAAGDDSWISIAVATDDEWRAMRSAMGEPIWAQDPDYDTNQGRWADQDRLDARISEWTRDHPAEELTTLLQAHGVAAVPSYTAEDLFTHPHLRARGSITEVDHPRLGTRTAISPPWLLSHTPARIQRTSPLLGEDNEFVLGGMLGLSEREIADLAEEQVVY
jgi:crotonobetainyl-CoA:carnitine CoA-transferase CaiB-like acyl-CoA transferase